MTWRDPRPDNESTEATCENLRELAAAYSPILRYDDRERVFPVLAEVAEKAAQVAQPLRPARAPRTANVASSFRYLVI